ncbi:MAG TPA: prepilin-type N-terminal cleavage/methylation domain-containing protein [Acidobacteriota bacterium]|nr:prepilin-type N-terminal cleavage/methylation domain-containing protein [Acidobacteriota bacterium]
MHHAFSVFRGEDGFTLLELLIAAFLSVLVAGAAMEFYVSQHDSWITQESVAEVQQSLRVCTVELSTKLRNAGGGLPQGFPSVVAGDGNPDTITVRYSETGASLVVGDSTTGDQANPVLIDPGSDLSPFSIGERIYIYRPPSGPGEFFTVTNLVDNPGTDWDEVHHQGQDLALDPEAGDVIVQLDEFRYWIDNVTDSLHPRMMRETNGAVEVYAEEIRDLQFHYALTNDSVVAAPPAGSRIAAVEFFVAAQTGKQNLTLAGDAGRLTRRNTSRVTLRNRPGAG